MGEINDWYDKWARRPRRISKVYPGQTILITVATFKDPIGGDRKNVKRAYVIDEVYPGFIRAHRLKEGRVHEETFNLGDLVQNGYEPVFPN